MSDRLASHRAQQMPARYANDYRQPPSAARGYDARQNPFAEPDAAQGAYEMTEVARSTDNLTAGLGRPTDASAFYAEISSIQDGVKNFSSNVASINDLHTRSLNNTDDVSARRTQSQLEELMEQTSSLSNRLRDRIKSLERHRTPGMDPSSRRQQIEFIKSKFMTAIQEYRSVEQQYRTKTKQRIERQFKIVKPDATPDEVRAVVDDEHDGQIFTQELLNSNRYGDSRAAYREVQARHADIKKIEKTMTELAQLFNDLSTMVEEQQETIDVIHENTVKVDTDIEVGLQHTEQAVESARGARKKRWICFAILLALILIIVIVALIHFHPWSH